MYSATLRRFIQRDPLEYASSPSALAYAVAAPIALTDPLGLKESGAPGEVSTATATSKEEALGKLADQHASWWGKRPNVHSLLGNPEAHWNWEQSRTISSISNVVWTLVMEYTEAGEDRSETFKNGVFCWYYTRSKSRKVEVYLVTYDVTTRRVVDLISLQRWLDANPVNPWTGGPTGKAAKAVKDGHANALAASIALALMKTEMDPSPELLLNKVEVKSNVAAVQINGEWTYNSGRGIHWWVCAGTELATSCGGLPFEISSKIKVGPAAGPDKFPPTPRDPK